MHGPAPEKSPRRLNAAPLLTAPLFAGVFASVACFGLACSGTVLDGNSGPPTARGPSGEPATPGAPSSGSTPGGSPATGGGNQPGSGGGGSSPSSCGGGQMAAPPQARLWRLTHAQYKNTVSETFGFTVPTIDTFPSESRLDGFANASERLRLSPALLEYYSRASEEIAAEAVKKASALLGCGVEALGAGNCLGDFLDKVGSKAWRRPLAAEEITRLRKLYTTAAADLGPEGGFRTVVQALVLSPNFLYRTELGAGGTGESYQLTDLELASALSYMLWDGPPDAALLDLAKRGVLHEPATLASEARRLATSSKAPEALFSFVQQWLEIEDFLQKPKDAMSFPTFTPELAKELEEESRLFVKGIFFESGGDRSVKTLLTAPFGYVNARTAKIYGATATGTALTKADLDGKQRRGILTQASFLAAHAEPVHTSVVARGRFMREEILCADVPPPPAEFKFDEKVITEDMTAREKFVEHSKNPACKGCHVLFDTLGFALENYDAIGQWRATEKGKTIDPSGEIPLPSGGQVKFANFVDLVDQLAKGNDAYACFSSQYLQYVTGRVRLDGCEQERIARVFTESGYKLDALVTAIVSSPGFTTRKN